MLNIPFYSHKMLNVVSLFPNSLVSNYLGPFTKSLCVFLVLLMTIIL